MNKRTILVCFDPFPSAQTASVSLCSDLFRLRISACLFSLARFNNRCRTDTLCTKLRY